VGAGFGREPFGRGNNLLLRKTVLASRIRCKNEIILVSDAANQIEFLLRRPRTLVVAVLHEVGV
jgi:hypothetical protein